MGKYDLCIEDCTEAIKLDSGYLKAYLRRAKAFLDSERYDEAVYDYEKIFQLDRTPEHKQLLKNAKLEQKKSKRKDYYKLLAISKSASDDEIKKAYKKSALKYHPDRHSHEDEEKQKQSEVMFKEISEAYSVLSDQKKKRRYDNGEDLMEIDQSDMNPNDIFQAFFSGSGGHPGFSFGGGGGGGQQRFTYSFG